MLTRKEKKALKLQAKEAKKQEKIVTETSKKEVKKENNFKVIF